MTEHGDWLTANDRFLSRAMAWLRETLEAAVPETPTGAAPPEPVQEPRALFGRRSAPRPVVHVPGPSAGPGEPPALPAALAEAETADDPPALIELARRFGLSTFERNVLLLAVGMELDTRVAGLCARVHGDPAAAHPTFALAMTVFDDPSWEVLSPERPLRHWHLVDVIGDGTRPLTSSLLRADDRVVGFVKGLQHLDPRLRPLLRPLRDTSADDAAPSQQAVAEQVVAGLRRSAQDDDPARTVLLVGPDAASTGLVAGEVARAIGVHLFGLETSDLAPGSPDLELLSRLWHRETLLAPVALFVDAHDLDRSGVDALALRRWLRERPGPVMVGARESWTDSGAGRTITVDVSRPTPAEQQAAWAESGDDDARRLAGQFDLDLATIHRVVRESADHPSEQRPDARWQACLQQSRPVLDQLAQRIRPAAGWGDLHLPEAELGQLRAIADQAAHRAEVYDGMGFRDRMNRGLGISVLFTGESGTGKTTAAEVLAAELGLLLYRIDLSGVVDKYLGETEKNLRRLFDAAEGGGAILFFDEADALFGKRSEVKDAHDRYANIEVNYLLQRLETFGGLAILATNRRSAMDAAFLRRLRFVVTFPFPGVAERSAMWADAFPPGAGADIDAARLARLDLTGGSIRTIALNAAFAAAAAGSGVTMPLVLDAARAELRKLGKPVNQADLRWLEPAEGSA